MFAGKLYITLALLSLTCTAICPAGYMHTRFAFCVVQVGLATEFCEACELCSNYGKQRGQFVFLQGRSMLAIVSSLDMISVVWSGINALLGIPESRSAFGWQDIEPKMPVFIAEPSEFKWGSGQPDENGPYLVYNKSDDAMYDVPQKGLEPPGVTVLCEFGGLLPRYRWTQRYDATYPKRFDNIIHPNPGLVGCPHETQALTKIDCVRRCALDITCRSVYFNGKEGKCVLMRHADSLLPQTIAQSQEDWSRFVRTKQTYP
ncbi:hypothetical protein CRM22_000436 [Opisthorchis felineus]|uniref:Apple domain-containing protein n=1 Tax=Opisthorchis felineus TaxID=147828 RepID=A0A4S2MF07_OPIFE|nr:hypothetical protein CRM22_000436 [Opisthorchis felineus]